MEKFKLFRYSLLAGLMIAIGGTVNLSVENKVVGAFLFSIGLFTVVNQQFALFTGRVGDFKLKQPAFLIDFADYLDGQFCCHGRSWIFITSHKSRFYIICKSRNPQSGKIE